MVSANKRWKRKRGSNTSWRLRAFRFVMVLFAAGIIVRLGVLQIMDHEFYRALASGQHEIFRELTPTRGEVLVHDGKDEEVTPIATNQKLAFIYADPRRVEDPEATAEQLGEIFGYEEKEMEALEERLSKEEDPYEPIEDSVPEEVLQQIVEADLSGIHYVRKQHRIYPEAQLGGHVVGFLGYDEDGSKSGKYGVEGYFEEKLSGTPGFLRSERDIAGRLIAVGERSLEPATDGIDVVLTIDRTIQYQACQIIKRAVQRHGAEGGSLVVMNPDTGEIMAMCASPDFDPNTYSKVEDNQVYNNPVIFGAYEPGSIFKPVTMAAALDTGSVGPQSTYEDTGEVKIDKYTIKNSDEKSYGIQTMTQVLEKSLNTGVIHAMRETGRDTFAQYIRDFGFGERTGVALETEVGGNVSSLEKPSEIYPATASFGQGITVTPLQMAAAYSAIANGGVLKETRIVDEVHHPDGTVEDYQTKDVRRVVDGKTSRLLGAMLTSVIENGHGDRAAVDGYYIAGKTGTAQVASAEQKGYDEDSVISSFAGFGPVANPRFTMVVRIDRPQDTPWASATAAPVFGEMAQFLVNYLNIPPTRSDK